MIEKVNKETATNEVNSWLDYKRVKTAQRETQRAQIDVMVEAVMYGDLTIDDKSFTITQKLAFPVTELDLNTLEHKARVSAGELQRASEKVKAGDFDGKVIATITALTGKASSHIQKMDSEDLKIAQAIAVFFL